MIALLVSVFFLVGAARAATSTESFPDRISARCPEQGLCRVEVPPPMVAANPRSWLLLDETGERVPFAVLEEDLVDPELRPVQVRATADPRAVSVRVPDGMRATELQVRVSSGVFQAECWLESRRGPGDAWRAGPRTIVAAGLVEETVARVRVPDPEADELRLVFDRPWTTLPAGATFSLMLWDEDELPPARVTVPLEASGPTESGLTRYTFRLPGMARLRAVELTPSETTYQRLALLESWEPGGDGLILSERDRRLLSRTGPGDEAVQTLGALDLATDRFAITVEDAWDEPLTIASAEVLLARRVLLVEDAGELTLYGGDPSWEASFDLQIRADELALAPAQAAILGAPERNPDWRDPFDITALDPGSVVDASRFRFSRPVTGAGIVRLELPFDVVLNARAGLSDLRLLDAQGRQIPYVQDRGAHVKVLEGLVETREEVGTLSRIFLKLPGARMPIGAISLESPNHSFSRSVRVFTGEGTGRRLLADSGWEGQQKGRSRRMIGLQTTAETGLLIEIDHGDNAPITIDKVIVYVPTLALLARLPEGGVTMVYGDVADIQGKVQGPFRRLREQGWQEPIKSPHYDAYVLAGRLMGEPTSTALLGEAVERIVEPSEQDRGAATVGVGVLVLGLLALMGWLLKDLRSGGGPTTA